MENGCIIQTLHVTICEFLLWPKFLAQAIAYNNCWRHVPDRKRGLREHMRDLKEACAIARRLQEDGECIALACGVGLAELLQMSKMWESWDRSRGVETFTGSVTNYSLMRACR